MGPSKYFGIAAPQSLNPISLTTSTRVVVMRINCIFIFKRLMSSFLWNCFLLLDCRLFAFTLYCSGVTSRGRGQRPKTVKGAQSDRNYVSRLLLDCVPVFHEIITPAYLLYRSGPVAIYYSRNPVANVCPGGGQKL